jgi:hypothetical protein
MSDAQLLDSRTDETQPSGLGVTVLGSRPIDREFPASSIHRAKCEIDVTGGLG